MIINELAYRVTIKADEFLNGKKKVEDGVKELGNTVTKEWHGIGVTTSETGEEIVKTGDKIQRSTRKTGRDLKDTAFDVKKFGNAATTSFRGAYAAAAGFLGNRMIRYSYLGFAGDLVFLDNVGQKDPYWEGLGSRYILYYIEESELVQ